MKTLLLISSLLFSSKLMADFPKPITECGLYEVQGKLLLNSQKHMVLLFNQNSPSQFELLIKAKDKKVTHQALVLINQMVNAKVDVRAPSGKKTKSPWNSLLAIKTYAPLSSGPIQSIKKHDCKK